MFTKQTLILVIFFPEILKNLQCIIDTFSLYDWHYYFFLSLLSILFSMFRIEILSHLVNGECKLEEYLLKHPPTKINPEKAKPDLDGAKSHFHQVIKAGSKVSITQEQSSATQESAMCKQLLLKFRRKKIWIFCWGVTWNGHTVLFFFIVMLLCQTKKLHKVVSAFTSTLQMLEKLFALSCTFYILQWV